MKNLHFIIFLFVLVVNTSISQVGIGTENPLDGSVLDITSSDKGVLVPRVDIIDLATVAPVTGGSTVGLLVWNTNTTTGVGFHYWSGSSNWVALSGAGGTTVNAVNGLVTSPTDIRLGGDLIQGTTIPQGAYDLTHNLNGLGDFHIADNGVNRFSVFDNGNIGIRNPTPTSMLHMTNGGQNVGFNVMARFDNSGIEGNALQASNVAATSGFNAIEGITRYNGTAFNPAGVFGFASGGSLTHSAIGVRGSINGRDGTGVYGTRQNGAGAGWGGLFLDDLGYTGFFGTASDRRLKKNILPIDNALDIVLKLNPVTYNFDLEKYPYMGLNTEKEYGFIAQEVREILPEITREKNLPLNGTKEVKPNQAFKNESESFLILDYTRIIPVLTKAIKEQQTTINKQSERLDALEKKINLLLSKT